MYLIILQCHTKLPQRNWTHGFTQNIRTLPGQESLFMNQIFLIFQIFYITVMVSWSNEKKSGIREVYDPVIILSAFYGKTVHANNHRKEYVIFRKKFEDFFKTDIWNSRTFPGTTFQIQGLFQVSLTAGNFVNIKAVILDLCPANKRHCYKVTPSLIGSAQT